LWVHGLRAAHKINQERDQVPCRGICRCQPYNGHYLNMPGLVMQYLRSEPNLRRESALIIRQWLIETINTTECRYFCRDCHPLQPVLEWLSKSGLGVIKERQHVNRSKKESQETTPHT